MQGSQILIVLSSSSVKVWPTLYSIPALVNVAEPYNVQSDAAAAVPSLMLMLKCAQNEAEAYLWEHCPRTVHRFVAFAQRLDDRHGVNAAVKWRDIAVSAVHALNPKTCC